MVAYTYSIVITMHNCRKQIGSVEAMLCHASAGIFFYSAHLWTAK